MKLSVERMPESQVLLDIAADEDEFARAMERAYRTVSRQLNVPGFRRGHAPRQVIERMYGRELFLEEAQKEVMQDLYRRALEQEDLIPVGEPAVDLVTQEPVGFRVVVPVFPTVEPGPYAEARVEPIDAAVTDEEVEDVVDRLRKARGTWVAPGEPRTPRAEDQITIDLTVQEGDEPFQEPAEDAVFVLGDSNLFDELREKIEQMSVGETATVELVFAEDDETVNETLRGKALTYTIALKDLKERELPALDDEFAKTVAEAEDMDALRRAIRDDIHRRKTREARTSVVNQAVNAMAETATVDLPAVMIDEQVGEEIKELRGRLSQQRMRLEEYLRVNDQTEEELREELRPAVARRLRNSLLMRKIAEQEGIDVSDDDVGAEITRLVAPADNPEQRDQMAEFYRSDYFSGILRGDLFERRVADRLIEMATEGRGAVLNGWVEPEEDEGDEGEQGEADLPDAVASRPGDVDNEMEAASAAAAEDGDDGPAGVEEPTSAESTALDGALTTGTMSGQPGDIAAVVPESASPAVTVADVAVEPDAAQAAAIGHDAENASVAAEEPPQAVTPEEREAQGEPGAGGVLADPES